MWNSCEILYAENCHNVRLPFIKASAQTLVNGFIREILKAVIAKAQNKCALRNAKKK